MKKVLLLLFAGIIVAATAGWLMWNKPHETVDDKKGIQITAEELSSAFLNDEQKANSIYLNQVIEVSGTIAEISKNQDGKDVILLECSDPLSGVQCTMRETAGIYYAGETTVIKGFCTGFTTVVLLSDCIKPDAGM